MHLDTKTRLLKASIYAAGLICFGVFLLVRIRGGAESVVYKQDYYNARDLYKHHYIEHFRESHPAFDQEITGPIRAYRETPANPAASEADVLVFGDSFMNFRWLPSFPERLRDRTGKRVHFSMSHYPLRVLADLAYERQAPRPLLYEIGEKGIYQGYHRERVKYMTQTRTRADRPLFEMLGSGKAERHYTALLQLSMLTHRLYKRVATWKFDAFGYISPMTPVYLLDPPILFLRQTVNDSTEGFYYRHSEEEIGLICDNIARMGRMLKEQYNLDLWFMPVPNKITLYHGMVWDAAQYNQFIPRVLDGLRERGVNVVDLYTPFRESKQRLYFLSDTHWNEHGIERAVDVVIETMSLADPEAATAF